MSTVEAYSTSVADFGTDVFLDVDALAVDQRYQRPSNHLRIRQMTPFTPSLFGRLTVNRRTDGSFWVVDGQHRLEAAKRSGQSTVPCTVYEGWSLKDEAWIYEFRNRTQKKPSQYELHKAAVLYGDPIAADLEKIVAEIGGAIGPRNSPSVGTRKHIACVDTLRGIYGMRNEHGRYPVERYPKLNGREHLRKTLHLVNAAWGDLSEESGTVRPFHGAVVKGMAIFLWHATDDPNFQERDLTAALGTKFSPEKLVTLASHHVGISLPRGIAREIKAQYNSRTRTKKLGDWDVRDLPK